MAPDSRLWVEINSSLGFCSLHVLPRFRILGATVGIQARRSLCEVPTLLVLHQDDIVTTERCGQRRGLLKQPKTQATVGRPAPW